MLAALATLVAWTTIRAVADQWDSITVDLDIGIERLVESADDAGADTATAQDVAEDVTVGVKTIIDWIVVGVTHVLTVVRHHHDDRAGLRRRLLLHEGRSYDVAVDLVRLASGYATSSTGSVQRMWTTICGYIVGQTMIAAIDAR